jgi:hypothetical protein
MVTTFSRLLRDSFLYSTAAAALVCIIGGFSHAQDQDGADDPANFAWQAQAVEHAQGMRGFLDPDLVASDGPAGRDLVCNVG